jgi:homoserine dehydrogenase
MRLILIGFGTVGQGLAELLIEKRDALVRDYGLDAQVVGIADMLKGSVADNGGLPLERVLAAVAADGDLRQLAPARFDGDVLDMIRTVDADAMLEATYTDIQTGEPATSHVRAALERGMHVVTTNKGPVALHYHELRQLAQAHGVRFLFEGAVMSGTPVLNLIRTNLAGSRVTEVQGILNGTTNYILTQMEAGLDYTSALAQAQQLGYAEAVPDADVLGWDALAKVTILANVVFGADLKPGDSPCQGITEITPALIAEARAKGQRYKLIGRVWRDGDAVKASVAPRAVDLTHPLAGVAGATNALTITTDTLGDVTVIGPGAGRRPTGYAMLIDLIHLGGRP